MSIKNNVIAFAPRDVFFTFFFSLVLYHIERATREKKLKIDEWKTVMFYGGPNEGGVEMYLEWKFIREIHSKKTTEADVKRAG